MSVFLTNIPAQVLAHGKMIPTTVVATDMTRTQAEARVQGFLNNADVRKALSEQGLSADEINQRISSLSDVEVKQLAGQMEQAKYGGDILITILVIVLIIFLIKRI